MAIPGYDTDDASEVTLEHTVANVSVVAATVPDELGIVESDATRPPNALSKTFDLVGLDSLEAVEALEITLAYDPAGLPPGASPTEVAVAVQTDDGLEILESDVNLGETEVSAVQYGVPSETTVVAVHPNGE